LLKDQAVFHCRRGSLAYDALRNQYGLPKDNWNCMSGTQVKLSADFAVQ
jgi:hypothetical protein